MRLISNVLLRFVVWFVNVSCFWFEKIYNKIVSDLEIDYNDEDTIDSLNRVIESFKGLLARLEQLLEKDKKENYLNAKSLKKLELATNRVSSNLLNYISLLQKGKENVR